MRAFEVVYHIELRHFPHNASRFNLTEQELQALLQPWVREHVVEFGERKWSPHVAKLIILEGPQLDVAQLSMGRGWRSAQRTSQDVTDRVLDAAREAAQASPPVAAPAPVAPVPPAPVAPVPAAPPPAPPIPAASLPAPAAPGPLAGGMTDPVALGVHIAALLGSDPVALLDAWRAAAARSPELAPSESLALAEHAVRAAARDQR